ncbi:hypothetical protein J6590_082692 [Homalodisca vitripennis]|nr:hypothetical protein J6590_082692 [Homalodisca vitripennis]
MHYTAKRGEVGKLQVQQTSAIHALVVGDVRSGYVVLLTDALNRKARGSCQIASSADFGNQRFSAKRGDVGKLQVQQTSAINTLVVGDVRSGYVVLFTDALNREARGCCQTTSSADFGNQRFSGW